MSLGLSSLSLVGREQMNGFLILTWNCSVKGLYILILFASRCDHLTRSDQWKKLSMEPLLLWSGFFRPWELPALPDARSQDMLKSLQLDQQKRSLSRIIIPYHSTEIFQGKTISLLNPISECSDFCFITFDRGPEECLEDSRRDREMEDYANSWHLTMCLGLKLEVMMEVVRMDKMINS